MTNDVRFANNTVFYESFQCVSMENGLNNLDGKTAIIKFVIECLEGTSGIFYWVS